MAISRIFRRISPAFEVYAIYTDCGMVVQGRPAAEPILDIDDEYVSLKQGLITLRKRRVAIRAKRVAIIKQMETIRNRRVRAAI